MCILSGGAIGPAARKKIDCINQRKALSSMEKINDIKAEIRTDLSLSLQKQHIQGIRLY